MGGETIGSTVVEDNSTIRSIPTVSRNGYSFGGWWTQRTGGTKLTEFTKITQDITFYAHWTQNDDPVTPYYYEPEPIEPYPVEPYPVEPYPTEPYPIEPYYTEPYYTEPYPTEPYPIEPYSVEPYPIEPYPVDPYSGEQEPYSIEPYDEEYDVKPHPDHEPELDEEM